MIVANTLFTRLVRNSPYLLIALLVVPVLGGLLGVLLPAFGWFPALGANEFGLFGFVQLFNTPGIERMVLLSFGTSLVSTLLAFVITVLILASYFNSPWLKRIQRLLGPILVIPHAAAAIAIGFLITPSGFLSRLISPWLTGWDIPPDWLFPHDPYGLSIILGLTLKELPFLLLIALGVLAQPEIGKTLKAQHKVASSLGYCPMTGFFKVILPSLYGYMRLPILAVLAYSSASVEIPLILGSNTPPTLAVAIMQWFNDVDLSLRIKASSGAILQILITLSLLGSWCLLELLVKKCSTSFLVNGEREYGGMLIQRMTHLITTVMLSVICLALVAMVLWSFAGFWSFPDLLPQQLVTLHWSSALLQMQTPLFNTLVIAISTTLIAIALTLFVLEAEQQNTKTISAISGFIIYLPLLIPSIAFLFGLVWLFEQVNSQHAYINVVFSHLLFVLPYVFLSLANSYRRLDPRFSTVAASLGVQPSKIFWQLKLPLLLSPILIASALGLAISFSQYLPTLLSGAGRINTITTEAVTLANGASRRTSAVYALMQMLLPALFFILAWAAPKLFFRNRG
ncbi:ABC transporter permease subunit [Psychromonas arctica]|uniref:ABC transporter permease subunit n=1 Tax=Psychromonas arctica TaxID=168275 RepID=A0ABU9HCD2_9GAMM